LVLKVPPKPIASPFDSGRREQSRFMNVASFSVIAEKREPMSTKKLTILLM
jgi:hypothetical protein